MEPHIMQLYNKIMSLYKPHHNKNNTWRSNIIAFIEKEIDKIEEIDDDVFESNFHIAETIFYMFTNALDIDEDDFDGPNDLHPSEWIMFDMLVVYHSLLLDSESINCNDSSNQHAST